jgi:hypothetical protein
MNRIYDMTKRNYIVERVKSAALAVAVLFLIASAAQAQNTGKLTVTGRVQGSIGLVFNDNPQVGTNGFCPLTNAGTNNVGLDMGNASFTTGDTQSCVNFFRILGFYFVSSGFDVLVTKANTTSANYQLAASISTTPPANVFWSINFGGLNTTFTTIQNSNNYGTPVTETLGVLVGQNVPPQTLLETINFLATAN